MEANKDETAYECADKVVDLLGRYLDLEISIKRDINIAQTRTMGTKLPSKQII